MTVYATVSIDRWTAAILAVATTTYSALSNPSTPKLVELPPTITPSPTFVVPTPINTPEATQTSEMEIPTSVSFEGKEYNIVRQPEHDTGFVSTGELDLTLYEPALVRGVLGFEAHNDKAGADISNLEVNDIIKIGANDNVVTKILKVQKIPKSVHNFATSYINLETGEKLSTSELFDLVYSGDEFHAVFQTCIEESGNLDWGRIFVITAQ